MDDTHFDALARRLSSRRTALVGLLGGVTALLGLSGVEEADAHNLVPACQRIDDPVKRRKCLARARRHKRQAHSCKPQPLHVTCANRCGTARNNCKKAVACTCPPGKTCLANQGCNRTCTSPGNPGDCPAGCACEWSLAENPTAFQCGSPDITSCTQVPLPCVTNANCPRGSFCADVSGACGTSRCVPNCPY